MICPYCPYITDNDSYLNTHVMYHHGDMLSKGLSLTSSMTTFANSEENKSINSITVGDAVFLPKEKTLKRLAFHLGIDVKTLEGYLEAKDNERL